VKHGYLAVWRRLAALLALLASGAALAAGAPAERNVILVTIDGVRMQEIFGGMDPVLANAPDADSGIYEADVTKGRYWRDTPEARREALMPFFWKTLAPAGMVLGNQAKGSKVTVRNDQWFSYPGYSEILTGQPQPEVKSNDFVRYPHRTVLEYAHDKRDDAGNPLGLVHRDITPENVIVSERGEVKILDFGIMKAKQRVSQTDSGTVRGNVGFMSPEQARGRAVDHRSDLFSTGLVILYAATGEPTYSGQTFYDLLTSAASGPGPLQQARIAALPAPLPAILARALAFDPDKRFQSSAEFSAALAPHLDSGGQRELAHRLLSLFGDELRAEQDRLAAAYPSVSSPEPAAGAGA